jgi:hypothetical protein
MAHFLRRIQYRFSFGFLGWGRYHYLATAGRQCQHLRHYPVHHLTVTAVADASSYFDANFQETHTWANTMRQIGFDLTAPAQVRIDWSHSQVVAGITTSNFTLRGPGGTLLDGISLIECDEGYFSCNFNSPIINLDQGHYELFFNSGTTQGGYCHR